MNFLIDHDVPDEVGRVMAQGGNEVHRLREVLPIRTPDLAVLEFAHSNRFVFVTCNRDHFLHLGAVQPHSGIIILMRRKTRVLECSRMLRLIETAGTSGIQNNINFA